MITLSIAEIAEIVGGTLADIGPAAAAATPVTGSVEFDSRSLTPGGLFLALPGANSDGHDFASDAVAAGAVVVLAARPVGVPAVVVPAGTDVVVLLMVVVVAPPAGGAVTDSAWRNGPVTS